MKHINFLAIVTLMSCCTHKNPIEDNLHSEKGIILSCVRCTCMEKLLERYAQEDGFSTIPIYTDSNCLERGSVLKGSIQFTQSKLDSLYKENYNIILFKKSHGRIEYRVINTNEVLSFNKTMEKFFSDSLFLKP